VLTAYSHTQDVFDQSYETLLTDVTSLLAHYVVILERHTVDPDEDRLELEFEVTDPSYTLYALTDRTESTIRLDSILKRSDKTVQILVTVLDGDATAVRDQAVGVTAITAADWFGDPDDEQLVLTVKKPFFGSLAGKYGGELVESVADGDSARARIEFPNDVAAQPLIEALTTQYTDVTLRSRRQATGDHPQESLDPADVLTDRQYEVLQAAYHGGYYETPRGITGEELATSFDISGPVIHEHLQAAHRSLLDALFETTASGIESSS
jgi:hypothetical protein